MEITERPEGNRRALFIYEERLMAAILSSQCVRAPLRVIYMGWHWHQRNLQENDYAGWHPVTCCRLTSESVPCQSQYTRAGLRTLIKRSDQSTGRNTQQLFLISCNKHEPRRQCNHCLMAGGLKADECACRSQPRSLCLSFPLLAAKTLSSDVRTSPHRSIRALLVCGRAEGKSVRAIDQGRTVLTEWVLAKGHGDNEHRNSADADKG